MPKGVNHNDYHINKQNNTATFQLRDKHLNNVAEFTIDAFDPEKDARQFAQLMSLCNGLVICD